MQLSDSSTGKEHVTCCAYFNRSRWRSSFYVKGTFTDSFTTDIPCINCLDADLGDSTKSCTAMAGGFDEEQVGASTPTLTWEVRKPSRYKVDSSLPKAIRASHIVVSACDTLTLSGDCMLLFNAMPVGLGDGRDNKGKKVHICAKHSQASINERTRLVAEHTNEYKFIRHAGLSIDSLLT